METSIVFYTIHCSACKGIQQLMNIKKIPYQIVDNRDEVLKKADELNVKQAPFAIINGQCYVNENLKKWVKEYKA